MTFRPIVRGRGVAVPSDHGAVTAETAIVMPTIVLLLAAVLAGLGWASQLMRCQAAAGDVARAVARGEPDEEVRELAQQATPHGARSTIVRGREAVTVRVRWSPESGSTFVRLLPDIDVEAVAAVSSS